MASPSIKFKKLLLKLEIVDRANVVSAISRWVNGIESDPKISQFRNFLGQLESNCFLGKKDLENNIMVWALAEGLNDCVSFQEVVKSKLAIPKKNIDDMLKKDKPVKHKAIPKKTREALWTGQFGDTTKGACYCCKTDISVLGTWHAGHVIAQTNGGSDTVENLRAICLPCNLAMATENMEEFKRRCYPAPIIAQAPQIICSKSRHFAIGKR
jgi:5-methylcytosine-specific restriction endonuclease McrA